MRTSSADAPLPHRRRLLQAVGGMALVAPVLPLLGCRRDTEAAGPTNAAAPAPKAAAAASRWAGGGTARIGSSARFPDPFAEATGTACVLTCMTTIGPCHATSPERIDISDGWDGLPLRLALRVVDADCKPVPGAIVELWHTNHTGGYSGRIARMCNNDQDDVDKQFFRGYQRSDDDGRVDFNTCYPGWYSSRAVHIHVRVLRGDYDGNDRATSAVTTQLLFSDALNHEVFTGHALYSPHGEPDTPLASDNVVGGEVDVSPYLFDVQCIDDGVMFASKTLVIRTAQDAAVCEAKGRMRAGGPGGPPPDGAPPPGA